MPGRERHALRVVAGAGRDDATRPFRVCHVRDAVVGAAQLVAEYRAAYSRLSRTWLRSRARNRWTAGRSGRTHRDVVDRRPARISRQHRVADRTISAITITASSARYSRAERMSFSIEPRATGAPGRRRRSARHDALQATRLRGTEMLIDDMNGRQLGPMRGDRLTNIATGRPLTRGPRAPSSRIDLDSLLTGLSRYNFQRVRGA